MRTSLRIGGAFACAFGIAIAGQVSAQDLYGPPPFGNLVWQNSGLYGSFGGRYENRGIGSVNTFRFLAGGVPHLTVEPNPNLGGPSGAIGYAFRDGTLPPWLGTNFRAEISGWWLTGSGSASSSGFFPAGTVTGVSFLNGFTVLPSGVVLAANLTEDASAKATMNLFRARLRFASDIPLNQVLVVSPFIGVAGGESQLKYSLRVNESVPAPVFTYVQNTKIRWTDIGGTAGVRLNYSATPWLVLHVSGYAELVHRRARLTGDDCIGTAAAFGVPCNAAFGQSTISASANRFAVIGGGEVGLTYNGGYYLITIAGGAEHDTRVPALRAQQPGAAVGATGTAASLRFLGQTNFNASARMTLRF